MLSLVTLQVLSQNHTALGDKQVAGQIMVVKAKEAAANTCTSC
jgi:hypothetical protein